MSRPPRPFTVGRLSRHVRSKHHDDVPRSGVRSPKPAAPCESSAGRVSRASSRTFPASSSCLRAPRTRPPSCARWIASSIARASAGPTRTDAWSRKPWRPGSCRGFPARRLCRSPARQRERAALRFHRGGGAARGGRSRRSGARRASWGRCAAHRAEGRHRRPAEAHARAARRRRLRGARRHGAARGPIRRIAAPSRVPPRVPRPRARGLRETSA